MIFAKEDDRFLLWHHKNLGYDCRNRQDDAHGKALLQTYPKQIARLLRHIETADHNRVKSAITQRQNRRSSGTIIAVNYAGVGEF